MQNLTQRIYLVIGIILFLIGITNAIAWITLNPHLATFFTNQYPLDLPALFSIFCASIFFGLKWYKSTPLIFHIKQASAICIVIISALSFILIMFQIPLSPPLFLNGEDIRAFIPQPHILWLVNGLLLFKTTPLITRKQLPYIETINFVLLFFAILGVILSIHKFTLIYIWLNKFAMPLAYAIALAIVNVGMIIYCGDIRQSASSHNGEEDRQIRFFSISMISQAILSAIFLGAMLVAAQSEFFLRHSLEKYISLKTTMLKDVISNEINEIERATESLDTRLSARAAPKLDTIQDEIELFRNSQNVVYISITDLQGKIIFSKGNSILPNSRTLKIKAPFDTILIRNNDKWYIQFQASITVKNKTLGLMTLQKPLETLDQTLPYQSKLFSSQAHHICSKIDDSKSQCLSFLPDSDTQQIIYNDSFSERHLDGAVFLQASKIIPRTVSVIENLPNLELQFLMHVNISDIENTLLSKVGIAFPFIVLFIVFFMRMLNWHILPIFYRSINAEKDAIESARMLMESESRIRTIIDNIGESVVVFMDNGKIESMNLIALQTFKYDHNTARSLSLPDLLNLGEDDIKKLIASRSMQWIETKGIRSDNTTFDAQTKFKDLTVRHRQLFIAIIRDITEQKLFEHRLSQSEKVFRNSFDHAPIGMMVLDIKNKITQVNQAMCVMLEYHESELKGNYLKKILPEHLRLENSLPFVKLTEIGMKNFVVESPLLTKSGKIIQTISTLTLFAAPNHEESFFVVQVEDVTMRQHYEKELKAANTELENRLKELQVNTLITEELNTMNGVLQSCLKISEALAPIEKFAEKLFHDTPGGLYLTAPESSHMELAVRWGIMNQNIDVIHKEDCWSLRRSQQYIAIESKNDIRCHHYENLTISGHLCIPLTAQGDLVGLVTLYSTNEEFDSQISPLKRLASSFADHIALSLSNIRLRESLHKQSISDPLTNLYNRRFFDENVKMELLRAERKGSVLSLLIIDIDLFKTFNDTYGHEVGDLVLKEVSNVLKKHLRESDIACRMGGEEFAIIMPEASKEVAFDRAEEIRLAITNINIKNGGRPIEPITVSIGIATYPNHAATLKTLIESADAALYHAKHNGRNRTISVDDL